MTGSAIASSMYVIASIGKHEWSLLVKRERAETSSGRIRRSRMVSNAAIGMQKGRDTSAIERSI